MSSKDGSGARRHRVAILGAGAMGTRHARVFSELAARFALAGVFDVSPDAAREAARTFGTRAFDDEAEALASVDAVVVASPVAAHAGAVMRALLAGRHVLVEKPITADGREVRELVRTAARTGRRLVVGHSERFNPVVRALAKLLKGDVVEAMTLRRVGRTRPQADPLGVLLNLGVHDLDLAAYLGGGPVTVQGAAGLRDDLAHVLLTLASGGPAHVYVDRTAAERGRSLVVRTPRWTYEGDLLGFRLVRIARGSGARTDVPLPAEEPLRAQAIAFADVLDGAPHREIASGADGARAVLAAERAASLVSAGVSAGGPFPELARELPRFAEKL